MTESIRIGDDTLTMPRSLRPLTRLPARLDRTACLSVLAHIDPEIDIERVSASRNTVTLKSLDEALEASPLGTEDRIRLKLALSQHGILATGKKV